MICPRYVPKDRPSAQSFEVAGVSVDMVSSGHNTVMISSVTRDTAGTVMCEVSNIDWCRIKTFSVCTVRVLKRHRVKT